MLELFIIMQFYYVNKLDYITQKTYQAAYIQSGLSTKVDERKKIYQDKVEYKVEQFSKTYLNKDIEKNVGRLIMVSDLLINKKIGITYEF